MKNIQSILVDTSALIALSNSQFKGHDEAKGILEYAIKNNIALKLSSIVVSEFTVKQPLQDIPDNFLLLFEPLIFNHAHANLAGKLGDFKFKRDDASRDSVKDDIKIISQVIFEEIDGLLTGDLNGVQKYFNPLLQAQNSSCKILTINKDINFYLAEDDSNQGNLFQSEIE
jgi:hypothetical protein